MSISSNGVVNQFRRVCGAHPAQSNNIAVNVSKISTKISSILRDECKFFIASFLSGTVLFCITVLFGGWRLGNCA